MAPFPRVAALRVPAMTPALPSVATWAAWTVAMTRCALAVAYSAGTASQSVRAHASPSMTMRFMRYLQLLDRIERPTYAGRGGAVNTSADAVGRDAVALLYRAPRRRRRRRRRGPADRPRDLPRRARRAVPEDSRRRDRRDPPAAAGPCARTAL